MKNNPLYRLSPAGRKLLRAMLAGHRLHIDNVKHLKLPRALSQRVGDIRRAGINVQDRRIPLSNGTPKQCWPKEYWLDGRAMQQTQLYFMKFNEANNG